MSASLRFLSASRARCRPRGRAPQLRNLDCGWFHAAGGVGVGAGGVRQQISRSVWTACGSPPLLPRTSKIILHFHAINLERINRSEEHTSELQSPCNLV